MIEHLFISAVGSDRPDIVRIFTELVHTRECQIELTHMRKYGDEFSLSLLVSGHWGAITKLETELDHLQDEVDYDIIHKRTKDIYDKKPGIPYVVQVLAPNDPGILAEVSAFFIAQSVSIREVAGYRYMAQQTGTEMFNLQMNTKSLLALKKK